MLLNSPKVQQRVSVILATELENRIGTRVDLGGVRWLFPTDIIIDSLTIDDQEGEHLLSVDHIAAKVEWKPLILDRQLSIRNIRLFHPNVHIYRADADSDYNFQFLIDAFATKSKKEKKPSRLSLRINTLLVRHAHVCHHDNTQQPSKIFQFNDLDIDDLSAQLSLKTLSTDSASLIVRHLKFKEQSGLCIDDLYFRLVANRQGATLANFQLNMPHSALKLDTIWAAYNLDNKEKNILFKGKIQPSHVTPADLAFLAPQIKDITERIHFSADFTGSPSRFNLKEISIHTSHRDVVLRADAKLTHNGMYGSNHKELQNLEGLKFTMGNEHSFNLHEATITNRAWTLLADEAPDIYSLIPQQLISIGHMTAAGNLRYDGHSATIDLRANTEAGNLKSHMELDEQGNYTATLDGESIDIAQIIPESPITHTNITLLAEGTVGDTPNTFDTLLDSITGTLHATATQTHMHGYEYKSITLDGNYAPKCYEADILLDDPNGALSLNATYDARRRLPYYTATLRADSLDLYAMQLIDIHKDATFSARLDAELRGKSLDHLVGKIIVDSLTIHRPGDDYLMKEMGLYASEMENKMLSLHTEFMSATVRGEFTYQSLASSLLGHLHHSLPSLCHSQSHQHEICDNLCIATVSIDSINPLRELLLLPIDVEEKASFNLTINDPQDALTLTASIPHLCYDNNIAKAISIDCHSLQQGLDLSIEATLYDDDGNAVKAELSTRSAADSIVFGAVWNSNPVGLFEGTFHTQAALALDNYGNLTATFNTDSTRATINHSEWELDPFHLGIAPGRIQIDGLHFANDTIQHLSVNGAITRYENDTLCVDFNNLDLEYLLSLVKLEGISFGGNVSGQADIASVYTQNPYIEATVSAQDFTFCEGPMGNVNGHIHWNQDDTQLQFTANVSETAQHTTAVDGIVDLNRDELWIDIAADSFNVSFLNDLLESFMSDVNGYAYGHLTVGGTMDSIDLNGSLLTDVAFKLTPTETNYHFRDSLRLSPGKIVFRGIEAYDKHGQKAIVTGAVTHNCLEDFSCDLNVDAQNVLGIKLPNTGNNSFYTTIFGTGDIDIKSTPNSPLTIDIQAQTEKGSLFALNLANQDAASSESFITFTDRSVKRNVPTIATYSFDSQRRERPLVRQEASTNINIAAQITPDAELKLVMNQALDDHISVSGEGDLQVNIQDEDINLFGTYTVNRGFYRLNLQDVINKNFDVLSGSTVSFKGDPMAADLNITARHTVNYVPLKDLSPELTGNVHVSCLLEISGTLNAPVVEFKLELPQGTEEEKAILRSYTNTEEQVNLQFIYLLGLGKFYTPDVAQNDQGTGNMESFISSTISGQINSLLSNIINNNNWNLASNLRTENLIAGSNGLEEEGLSDNNWENMEIEGILEGRLLDNRLLINGSFGYRDNPMYASNFIGDFDIRYLLTGGLSLKGYNKTNDRYFSRTSLTTQGLGLVFQRDFDYLFPRRKRKEQIPQSTDTLATKVITTDTDN